MEKEEFEYNGKKYCLTYLGDDFYKCLWDFEPFSKKKTFPYKDWNFFNLECDKDFCYTNDLQDKVNEIVNRLILSGKCKSRVTSIFVDENLSDAFFRNPEDPNLVSDGLYVGFVLPHLLIANMKNISTKKFQNIRGIKKVTITKDVRSIGELSFCGCSDLKEVVLEEGIQEIKDKAFADTNIETMELPKSLKVLGDNVFTDTPLKQLTVYSTLKKVGVNNIKVFHEHGKSVRLEDGLCNKKILILYDDTNNRSYLEEYCFRTSRCRKVYRENDIETGKWKYFSASGQEYKNTDSFRQYPEFSWHVEYPSLQEAESLKRHFSQVSDCKFDYHHCLLEPVFGWVTEDVFLIPENLKTIYQDFLHYKEIFNKYQNSLKDVNELEKLKNELLKIQEVFEEKISELSPGVDMDNYYLSSTSSDILPNEAIRELPTKKAKEFFKVKKF